MRSISYQLAVIAAIVAFLTLLSGSFEICFSDKPYYASRFAMNTSDCSCIAKEGVLREKVFSGAFVGLQPTKLIPVNLRPIREVRPNWICEGQIIIPLPTYKSYRVDMTDGGCVDKGGKIFGQLPGGVPCLNCYVSMQAVLVDDDEFQRIRNLTKRARQLENESVWPPPSDLLEEILVRNITEDRYFSVCDSLDVIGESNSATV